MTSKEEVSANVRLVVADVDGALDPPDKVLPPRGTSSALANSQQF